MRCLTLAESLTESGYECLFAVNQEAPSFVPGISRYRSIILNGSIADEPAQMAALADGSCDLVVVDHYDRNIAFENNCRQFTRHILAVDDLANRHHDCDFLLDQTLGRTRREYEELVPSHCRLLLGSDYALLRPSFEAHRKNSRARRMRQGEASKILVMFGADDSWLLLANIVRSLLAMDERLTYVAVSGPQPYEFLKESAVNFKGRLELIDYVKDPAPAMADADLAVGAAGTTTWERCAVGLPSAIIITAENQRLVAERVVDAGAAIHLGDRHSTEPDAAAAKIIALANDGARLSRMSKAGATICDGRGVKRILPALAGELATRTGALTRLRLAEPSDSGWLLALQNQPTTRRFARNPNPPTSAEHASWLEETLEKPNTVLLVIETRSKDTADSVGMLRLDMGPAGGDYEVSIAIDAHHHSLGFGTAALSLVRNMLPAARLTATILPENAASRALFLGSGYLESGDTFRQSPGKIHSAK